MLAKYQFRLGQLLHRNGSAEAVFDNMLIWMLTQGRGRGGGRGGGRLYIFDVFGVAAAELYIYVFKNPNV